VRFIPLCPMCSAIARTARSKPRPCYLSGDGTTPSNIHFYDTDGKTKIGSLWIRGEGGRAWPFVYNYTMRGSDGTFHQFACNEYGVCRMETGAKLDGQGVFQMDGPSMGSAPMDRHFVEGDASVAADPVTWRATLPNGCEVELAAVGRWANGSPLDGNALWKPDGSLARLPDDLATSMADALGRKYPGVPGNLPEARTTVLRVGGLGGQDAGFVLKAGSWATATLDDAQGNRWVAFEHYPKDDGQVRPGGQP